MLSQRLLRQDLLRPLMAAAARHCSETGWARCSRGAVPGAEEDPHDGPHRAAVDRLQAAGGRAGLGGDRGVGPLLHPAWPRSSSTCSTRSRDTGPIEAGALAASSTSRRPHLGSLLDRRGAGLLDQVRDVYELNDTARRYLVSRRAGLDGRPDPGRTRSARELDATGRHRPQRPPADPDRGRPADVLRPARRGHVHHDVRTRDAGRPQDPVLRPRRRRGCSTSAPAARRGRSPCSTPARRRDRGRQRPARRGRRRPGARLAEHGVADRVRAPRRATSTTSTSRPTPTTSSCSATCVAPRAPTGPATSIERAYAALAPGGRLVLADYFSTSNARPTRTP